MAPPAAGPEVAADPGAAAPGRTRACAGRLALLGPRALAEVALGLATAGTLATLAAPGAAPRAPRASSSAPPRRLAAVEETGGRPARLRRGAGPPWALAEELRRLEGARRSMAEGLRLLRQASDDAQGGLRELRGHLEQAAQSASSSESSSRSQEARCRSVHWSEECTFLPSDLVARIGGDEINGSADCGVVAASFNQRADILRKMGGMGRRIDAHSFVVRVGPMPVETFTDQLGFKSSVYFLHSTGPDRKSLYDKRSLRIQIQNMNSSEKFWCDVRSRPGCAFDAVVFKDLPDKHQDIWRPALLPVGMMKYEVSQALVRLYNLRFNITDPKKASGTRPANAFAAFLSTALLCNAVTGYGPSFATGSKEVTLMRELGSGRTDNLGHEGVAKGPAPGPDQGSFADRARRCLVAKARAGCIRVAA